MISASAIARRAALILVAATTHAEAQANPPWQENERNRPAFCIDVWQGIGLPKYASGSSGRTFVCHKRFALSHNNAAKSPDWVVQHLKKSELTNRFNRPNQDFGLDDRVPPNASPTDADYAHTRAKFEIGHMAPSEDFNNNETDMRDTFVYSNAVPQVGDKFNAAIWKRLETEVRKAAIDRGEIYVITGPLRGTSKKRSVKISKQQNACGGAIELNGPRQSVICAANNQNANAACPTGVAVPIALYKIIYDPNPDDPSQNSAYAFIMPNRDHPTGLGRRAQSYINGFRVNVALIERLTGLQFLRGTPAAQQSRLLNKCAQESLWATAQ